MGTTQATISGSPGTNADPSITVAPSNKTYPWIQDNSEIRAQTPTFCRFRGRIDNLRDEAGPRVERPIRNVHGIDQAP